jgi:nitrous oxidase accessory protein
MKINQSWSAKPFIQNFVTNFVANFVEPPFRMKDSMKFATKFKARLSWTGSTQDLRPLLAFAFLFALSTRVMSASDLSLQEKINAAQEGETIVVHGGVHRGNIVIDRGVTLVGVDSPIIQGDATSHVIQITAPNVTLRGFRIRGSGLNLSKDHAGIHVTADHALIESNRITRSLHGIYVRGASQVRIQGNVIRSIDPSELRNADDPMAGFGAGELCASGLSQDRRGNGIHFWNSNGNVVSGNDISETRDGIYFSFTNETRVDNNRVSKARYGLHYMYSHHNSFANNHFSENAAGAALMFSKEIVMRDNHFIRHRGHRAYGVVLQSVDRSVLERNSIRGNTTGIYIQSSYGNVLRRNQLLQNYIGIRLTSSSMDNRFSRNTMAENLHPLDLAGRSVGNHWEENGAGNFWAGATPLDLTHNGISELPHREVDLFGTVRKDFPYIAFLSGSPGMKAMQFALQRAPVPNAPMITDKHPLVAPPKTRKEQP